MDKLIRELFPSNSNGSETSAAISSLWNDRETQKLIGEEIGKKILESKEILVNNSQEQLMSIMSISHFADSQEECCKVASIVYWGINHPDIRPLVSEYEGRTLAYRCLISLGVFKASMIHYFERGAPHPSFYRSIGIHSFKTVGEESISSHFQQWESFLNEYFVL